MALSGPGIVSLGSRKPGLTVFKTGSSFSPLSLSPELLWDADSVAAANNTAIASWPDTSGHARHGTIPGTFPKHFTNVINGHSVVRFVAADTSDQVTIPNFMSGFTAGELFIVIKVNTDPPGAALSSGFGAFGSDTQSTHFPFTDGVIYDTFGTTARKTTVNPTPTLAAFNLYNAISTSSEWTSNLNGTQLFTTATNTVGFTTAGSLGRSASAHWLDGDVAYMILFSAKLSTANRTALKAYLATRFALTVV